MNICILWYIHAEIINLYILQSHQWIAAEYWYTVTAQQINTPVTYWMSEYWEKLINHACLPDRILSYNETRLGWNSLGWNMLIFAFQTVNKHVLENFHKKNCTESYLHYCLAAVCYDMCIVGEKKLNKRKIVDFQSWSSPEVKGIYREKEGTLKEYNFNLSCFLELEKSFSIF